MTRSTSLLITAALAVLAGCALTRSPAPVRVMAPQIEPAPVGEHEPLAVTLAVARPQADRTRDSDRILVRRDRQLMPMAGAAWLDRVPDMLQTLLTDYLHQSARFRQVARAGSLSADLRLELELRGFEAYEQRGDGLTAHVELYARLIDPATGELLAAQRFRQQSSAASDSPPALVRSFEQVLEALFGELGDWLVENLEGAVARK